MPPGSRTYTARTYVRDARDRIYAFAKGSDASINPMENGRGDYFWYDAEGQLTDAGYQALNPLTAPSGYQREDHFQYDQLGNRKQVARYGNSWQQWTGRDNGLNQIKDTPPWAGWVTHEDSYAPQSPGHNNGNLVTDGYMSANYNALNQPNWMYGNARASGNSLNFGYDPLGRCVKRWDSLGSTYLYYDGWNLITEGSRFDQPIRQYIHGARVDEIVWSKVVTSGVVAYHHYDARTHCMMLTGTGQNIIEQYDYDAFGCVYAYNTAGAALTVGGRPGSPYGNRFLFTGREWLWDLGVYDYRHRHYNPELGRFLQPDPKHFAARDYNLYRYCHNDAVNRQDPLGLTDVVYDKEALNLAVRMTITLTQLANGDSEKQTRGDGLSRTIVYFRDSAGNLDHTKQDFGKIVPTADGGKMRNETVDLGKGNTPAATSHVHGDSRYDEPSTGKQGDIAGVMSSKAPMAFSGPKLSEEKRVLVLIPQKEKGLEPRREYRRYP